MEIDIRKVSFPINIKLTIIVLLLTGISLFFYIWLALDLFKTDKIAYVFESVDKQSQQISAQAKELLKNIEVNHQVMELSGRDKKSFELFKDAYPSLRYFGTFRKSKVVREYYFEKFSLDKSKILGLINKTNLKKGFLTLSESEQTFLLYWNRSGDLANFSLYQISILTNLIPQSDLYSYDLVFNGKLLKHGDEIELKSDEVTSQAFQTYVKGKGKDRKIVSLIPLYEKQIAFMTWINYQKALNASQRLQERSLYFGLLVAGFVIIFILLFSSLLTKPIKNLYTGALQLAQSNFEHRVKVKQKDEIGVLGDSFNYMAQKIQEYMAQMQEKLRLENELKTAQLVQESFFPTDTIKGKSLALKAYYKPATECGGDWWGYFSYGDVEVVILLDVTGHGTAAALMTAIVQNSLTSLKYLAQKDPAFIESSAKIADFLNQSLCAVDINLNATCAVLVIQNGKLTYTNASHNPPYLLKHKDEYAKSDFIPLMDKIGARLGESKESHYEEVSLALNKEDHLVLYTDGIIEAVNSEEKQYGSRNFIKSLIKSMNFGFDKSLDMTISEFYKYIGDIQPDDDITLLRIDIN